MGESSFLFEILHEKRPCKQIEDICAYELLIVIPRIIISKRVITPSALRVRSSDCVDMSSHFEFGTTELTQRLGHPEFCLCRGKGPAVNKNVDTK